MGSSQWRRPSLPKLFSVCRRFPPRVTVASSATAFVAKLGSTSLRAFPPTLLVRWENWRVRKSGVLRRVQATTSRPSPVVIASMLDQLRMMGKVRQTPAGGTRTIVERVPVGRSSNAAALVAESRTPPSVRPPVDACWTPSDVEPPVTDRRPPRRPVTCNSLDLF